MRDFENGSSWTCPYCNQPVTVLNTNVCRDAVNRATSGISGGVQAETIFVTCPNEKCMRYSLFVVLYQLGNNGVRQKRLNSWQLIPASSAKHFPDYIPRQILEDYEQACLIRDLSPKASATLSRRCIQGMIRDYWGVIKDSLFDEINGIKDKVQPKTWDAIDAVRGVGNIGAHMEKDVNVIIDVEPNEAQLLLTLIETLVEDWYISRHSREVNADSLILLAKDKGVSRNK